MTPEKVVIFRTGSLVDAAMALPFFNRVAQFYPKSECILVTDQRPSVKASSVGSLIDGSGLVDDTLSYPGGTRDVRKITRLFARLRGLGSFDLVYLVEPPRSRTNLWLDLSFFGLCGARKIRCAPVRRDLSSCFVNPETGLVEMQSDICPPRVRRTSALGDPRSELDHHAPALGGGQDYLSSS